MKKLKNLSAVFLALGILSCNAQPQNQPNVLLPNQKKIQVLICLDVSGSMSGLIDQAKDQLWNMVSVMGRTSHQDITPYIEIALYEYGRPSNGINNGYIKRINGFTTDLDQVSKNLFGLTIDGGDEYCGHVLYTSLNELNWDPSPQNYKVIFIAGNEDFYQGGISSAKACALAREKGVIVNTIYCGDRAQGVREHWNLAGECGNGSFANINQNVQVADIATPYDNPLFDLNTKLNETYITYGTMGAANWHKQSEVDQLNIGKNKSAALKRVSVKSNKEIYKNSSWDLVDANIDDSTILKKIDKKTLPEAMKNKSDAEINAMVKAKKEERQKIQNDIASLSKERQAFIVKEKSKTTGDATQATLESEIEKIIKVQALKFKLVVK